MHQNSTSLLWAYQYYDYSSITDDVFLLNTLYEPIDVFQKLLDRIEDSTLGISDEVLSKILECI
ncbi:MAG TPA: hypothetical protein DG754_12105 [Bacteroidales bacterium]|jgi:hypothetical protein|nr:hypothetical protein [Bacteroidales bacterium]